MKILRYSFALLFVLALCYAPFTADVVYARHPQELVYDPAAISLTIPAGSSASFNLTVSLKDLTDDRSYWVWFLSSFTGTLPQSWLSLNPTTDYFLTATNPLSTIVTISVPSGTTPGTYEGRLYSRAMSAHSIASGTGTLITVTVQAACPAAPEIEITEFGPEIIWPPDHKLNHVIVSGTVSVAPGCNIIDGGLGYTIIDEYETFSQSGEFTLDTAGSFAIYLPVEASRHAQDKDGRHYIITLHAEDEAGLSMSDILVVLVPHDMRDKK